MCPKIVFPYFNSIFMTTHTSDLKVLNIFNKNTKKSSNKFLLKRSQLQSNLIFCSFPQTIKAMYISKSTKKLNKCGTKCDCRSV